MDAALYDLSPLAQLLLVGMALALLPLGWLLWRQRGQGTARRLHGLTLLTLFLTFDLVLFGAFTRLSDSGLGCPDWPGCYGHASPLGARAHIAAAQETMPTGPVTHRKAWVEMVHRYLASAVGFLLIVLTVASWRYWRRWTGEARDHHGQQAPPVHPGWPTLALLWVCVQGAFGALTVTMKLYPAIVTLHLLGGLGLLVLLAMSGVRNHPDALAVQPVAPALRAALGLAFALLVVQVALGGWVSTNYAVLACQGFPTCQGAWWPEMDFRQGFELARPLGHTAAGELLDFRALTAIHYTHRLFAYALVPLLAALAWRLWRLPGLRRLGGGLGALVLAQALSGWSNVVLGWPLLAALAHTGGAAALLLVLTLALCLTRRAPQGAAQPAHTMEEHPA